MWGVFQENIKEQDLCMYSALLVHVKQEKFYVLSDLEQELFTKEAQVVIVIKFFLELMTM